MIPRRIFVENFLSFGEPGVEFAFADDEPLWVLSGPNGSGKSAVFDAITYALFAQHRGGKQEHHQLIRHTANNFRIEFEFAYDGVQYRIVRVRGKKGKRSVQTVERRAGNDQEWEPVNVGDAATGITEWVTETIGLDYIAFTSSVLLKQGEADMLINAPPSKRLELLKKLIHIQPIEELYDRVHEEFRRCKAKADQADEALKGLPLVSKGELDIAEKQVVEVGMAKEAAHQQLLATQGLEAHAKQWQEKQVQIKYIEKKLTAASERAQHAEQIRSDYLRFEDLNKAVPTLEKLLPLPKLIAVAEKEVETKQKEVQQLLAKQNELHQTKTALDEKKVHLDKDYQAAKDEVDALEKSLTHARNHHKQAESLVQCELGLKQYSPDLDLLIQSTKSELVKLTEQHRTTSNQHHSSQDRLNALIKEQKDFASVEVGIKCSRCGLVVDAAHAAKEKQHHAELIAVESGKLEELAQSLATQTKLLKDCATRKNVLDQQHIQRTTTLETHRLLKKTLADYGVTATADELAHEIKTISEVLPSRKAHKTGLEQQRQQWLVDEKKLSADLKANQESLTTCRGALAASDSICKQEQVKQGVLLGQLPEAWKMRWPMSDKQVHELSHELKQLQAAGIKEKSDALLSDAGRRDEWQQQMHQLKDEVALLPVEAQLPVAEIQAKIKAAKEAFRQADTNQGLATGRVKELRSHQQRYKEQEAIVKQSDHHARLHARLDELLGKDKLQRELVRSAERDLVQTADTTLRHLTNGQLSLKLSDDKADDAAFNLQISKHHSTETFGIDYLSGSQKFRVAVALALAIGRYASSTNRPLESVIIDEGFGSLDRDGLASMANELLVLQRNAALKRIILVSHQEDFVERFPAGYALTPGEAGTTAKVWRR